MVNEIVMVEDDNVVVAGQISNIDLQNVAMPHFIRMQSAFIEKDDSAPKWCLPRKLMPAKEKAGPPLQEITDAWEKEILSYRDYLLDDSELFGVDEKKRFGGGGWCASSI